MTPAARLQAAIEVLQETLHHRGPADRTAQSYFRKRRYIGSKDRRAIQERLWRIWRRYHRLGCEGARSLVLKDAVIEGDSGLEELKALCTGEGHAPAPLSAEEEQGLQGARLSEAPECPDWLWPKLQDAFGETALAQLDALLAPAPTDLRVNPLKGSVGQALKSLARDDVAVDPIDGLPLGLRLSGRANLSTTSAFKKGLVEVQDAGSQIAAAALDVAPGMTVLDLCAGAGGKTLALAAQMENRGQIIACDVVPAKLDELKKRARRAGATNIRTVHLKPDQPVAEQLPRHGFDRALIDAPCSGSGTWRRAPDAKWKLTPDQLANHVKTQNTLLSQAAGLIGPGGRGVYVTCSVLPEENHTSAPGLTLEAPPRQLTPLTDQTDGFFIAAFRPE